MAGARLALPACRAHSYPHAGARRHHGLRRDVLQPVARPDGAPSARRLQPRTARYLPRDGRVPARTAIVSKKTRARSAGPAVSVGIPIAYADFVLHAARVNARTIAITVKSSPAGAMRTPITVDFSDAEAAAIRDSFRVSVDGRSGG